MDTRSRCFRYSLTSILLVLFLAAPVPAQTDAPVVTEQHMVAAPDGAKLNTLVSRPGQPGRYPAVVYRTPYGLDWMKAAMERYARQGYVCVAQDVRGRHGSEGLFAPFEHEIPDGDALLRWVRSQPWSNGVVASNGHSYVGFTALYLAAGQEGALRCIVADDPVVSPRGGLYTGGAMNHHFDYYWSILVDGRKLDLPGTIGLDWDKLFPLLPLRDAHRGVGRTIPFYRNWVDWANGSFGRDAFPEPSMIRTDSTAVLLVAGWFDLFCADVLDFYGQIRGGGDGARMKLIIGPFDHANSPPPESDMEFGDWQALSIPAEVNRWQDRWILEKRNGAEAEAPVRFFVMGENRWENAETWPPQGVREHAMYLRSDGRANTCTGPGRLDNRAPGKEPFDRYTYDPADPVPTRGGSICCLREMTRAGAMDQREIEKRSDVLVYTSEPLKEDLTIAGPVRLELFAASSARDTDFTGKLVDVHPDGTALNIVESIQRARFRNGDTPSLLIPGSVERYRFTLGQTAMTFKKGHRIRLEVSSSNFPRFDRNLNTGGPIGTESAGVKAEQKVYHDREHPSRIILPVWDRK